MQLAFRRTVRDVKGTFGGNKRVSFVLRAELSLSQEELDAVNRLYLAGTKMYDWEKEGAVPRRYDMNDLYQGVEIEFDLFRLLVGAEEEIIISCKKFNDLLADALSFDEETLIDFDDA